MIICTNCGNHNEDADEFCGSCGKFLEWVGQKVEEPAKVEVAEPESEPEAMKVGLIDRVKAAVGMEGAAGSGSTLVDEPPTGGSLDEAPPEAAGVPVPPQVDDEAETARALAAELEAQERARLVELAAEREREQQAAEAAAAAERERQAAEAASAAAAEAEAAAQEAERRAADEQARREAEAAERDLQAAAAEAAAAAAERERQAAAAAAAQADADQGSEEAERQRLAAEAEAAAQAAERDRLAAEAEAAAAAAAREAEEQARRQAEEAAAKARAEEEARRQAEAEEMRRKAEEERARREAEARAEAARRAAALLAQPKAPAATPPEPPSAQGPAASGTVAPVAPSSKPAPPRPSGAAIPAQPAASAAEPARAAMAPSQEPAKPKAPPKPATQIKVDDAPKVGDLICDSCGTGNDPTRKFCRRCGNSLVKAEAVKKLPWWKRIFGGGKKKPKASKGAKGKGAVKGAKQASFKAEMAMARARNVMILLAMVGIGGAMMLPGPRATVMNTARDGINSARDALFPKFSPIRPVQVAATSEAPGHPAVQAADLAVNTFWAEGAEADGIGQTITFTFPRSFELGKVLITPGAIDTNNPNLFLLNPRPKRLHLVFDNGASTDLTLQDEVGKAQTFTIKGAKEITKVDVSIVEVHPGTGGQDTAIAEFEFRAKG